MCMMQMMRGSDHSAHATATGGLQMESLLDSLKRRYALGEITREQFQEMKHLLGESDAGSTNEPAHPSRKEQ